MDTELASPPLAALEDHGWLSTPLLLALWVASGALLIWGLGHIPLERTQEARVLEVAREMIHQNFDGWMIPHANGVERLHKPPLAYWLSAISYELFGRVSLLTGRLPTAIAGWLTLGVVFWMVKWLFNRRAAFFAALALFASFLFAKFFRLAETDPLSALFTTAATFFLWRGIESDRKRNEYLWYHAGAAMLALALLAKGPQVGLVVLFFICYAAARRKWRCFGRFIMSGAPITFAVIGLPWWIYVYITRGAARWKSEIEIAAEGEGHNGPFYIYFPYMLYGIAPWCAFAVAGLIDSSRRVLRDWRHLGMVLWAATLFIPLCFVGNKQFHYLVPLMMPLAAMTGWLIADVWTRCDDPGFFRVIWWLLLATILVCLLLPAAIVIAAKVNLHHIRAMDWIVAAVVAVVALAALAAACFASLRRALEVFAACAVVCMVLLSGWWMPSMNESSNHAMKQLIDSAGADQPVVYYSRAPNLRFSFFLRRVVPVINDPDDLKAWLRQRPRTVVIVLKMKHGAGLTPPPFLVEKRIFGTKDETVGIYTSGLLY